MVFVIVCVIVGAVIVGAGFFFWDEDGPIGLFPTFLIGLLAAIFGAVAVVLFGLIPANDKVEACGQESLAALGNSTGVQGRFFLGTGYVDSKRTLNFIAKEADGGYRADDALASDSRVFEGSADPTVTYTCHSYSNGWVLPWDIRESTTYRFDVPTGSVLENYTLNNQ